MKTYQSQVDLDSSGQQNRPAHPGRIVGTKHTLVDIGGTDGTGDVDDNTKTENRHDSKSLPGGQLQVPNQWHGKNGAHEIGKDVDKTGGENGGAIVKASMGIFGLQVPEGMNRATLENADQFEQDTADSHKNHRSDQNPRVCPVQALGSRANQTLAEPEERHLGETGGHGELDLKGEVQLLHGRKPAHRDIPDVSIPSPNLSGQRGNDAHSDSEDLGFLVSEKFLLFRMQDYGTIPERSQ